jgi:hypothetical protein
MQRASRTTDAFRHGLRVRMGVTGPTGMLLQCEKKDGRGTYWKVRLQSGDWVWPEGLIVDGPGDQVAVCAQCTLPFMTTTRGDGLVCARCDEEIFGTRARAAAPRDELLGRVQRFQRRRMR